MSALAELFEAWRDCLDDYRKAVETNRKLMLVDICGGVGLSVAALLAWFSWLAVTP